jgi:hypothetical protein
MTDAELKLQAESDMNDARALQRSQPFNRYFMREPQRRIQELEAKLTDADKPLAEPERSIALGELKTWRRIVRKLDEDIVGNASVLQIDPSERKVE